MKFRFLPNCRKSFVLLALMTLFAFSATANPVGAERARLVAKHFLSNNGARSMGLKDLTAEAGFDNLYVFSTENSFVLVAADDCMQPILGYSLNGSFDLDNMPVNKAAWIQEYSQSIQYAVEHQTRATAEVRQQWDDLASGRRDAGRATTVVSPLIQTKWSQTNPYNLLCPSGSVTGCVATAMAQVMKYWNYPAHGIGSHSYTLSAFGVLSADFQNTTYDWAHMTNTYGSSSTYEENMAVAILMYHCGVSVDMDYGPQASGAVTSYVADALKTYFNYSSETRHLDRASYDEADWIGMLKADLDLGRPIQYHGRGTGGGHSFVVDGYDSNDKFHINWGWAGNCDEYYEIGNLNPGPGGTGSGAYGIYNDGQGAIFGIHPSNCTASEPANLTYVQDGRSITFSWTAASGAAGYKVYCDHNLVGQTTSTTFTHNASYGSSTYWVRSVDANGELSLSSNAVDITVDYPVPVVNDLAASLTDNNVSLAWTAPNWCYPETPTDTLTYGNGTITLVWPYTFYGHRYPATDMVEFVNKSVYKVGVYVLYPGDYTVYVYTDTEDGKPKASSLAATQSLSCPFMDVWMDFDLDVPVMLSGSNDLWVIIELQNTGQDYPVPSFVLNPYNANACYLGDSLDDLFSLPSEYTQAFFVRTYVADGTYTYNLYRNGSKIGNDLSTTSYSDEGLAAGVYNYYVKTNYYAGESPASNQVIQPVGAYEGHYFVTEGDWNNTSNWLPAVLPTGTDDVYVAASVTIPDGCIALAGSITMNNPEADFTIAEGGQLVSGNAVNGTIQKSITGYGSGNDGWYFIASPVDGFTPDADNLLTASYDLYRFDQTQSGAEWRNYKANSFDMNTGEGYLYASQDDVTLNITGELTATKAPVALDNAETDVPFKGWNLIGNPYPCNVTINVPFYRMEGDGSGLANQVTSLESTAIKPMEGVVVQYTTEAPAVSFTKAPDVSAAGSRDALHLSLSQGRGVSDNAIVRFDGGSSLEKFSLIEGGSRLYIPQGDKDYAIVNSDAQGEMPLNFKAAKDGEYTLSVNAEGLGLAYLHLIDNMTGADVDLLSTQSYTFSAKPTDYASRFRLVFNANGSSTGSDTFAFNNGNEWVIANEGEATLQVIDFLGRQLSSEKGHSAFRIPHSVFSTPGVYVLRLIGNENVRTQKIMIR